MPSPQIIEAPTPRIDEVDALICELRTRFDDGRSSAGPHGTITVG